MKALTAALILALSLLFLHSYSKPKDRPNERQYSTYKIIEASTAASLETQVQAKIGENWTLIGGVTVSCGKYYQAIAE